MPVLPASTLHTESPRGTDETALLGFRVVYALPELDAPFTDDVTILAYQRAGGPLPERDGAFRFVHSGDQRHARCVRGVTALTVVSGGAPAPRAR